MKRQSHEGGNIINELSEEGEGGGFVSELSLFHLKLAQVENYRVK